MYKSNMHLEENTFLVLNFDSPLPQAHDIKNNTLEMVGGDPQLESARRLRSETDQRRVPNAVYKICPSLQLIAALYLCRTDCNWLW